MKTESSTKKHADFQDRYRRSSNFRRVIPKREFELNEDGKLHLQMKTPKT
jgi:hypothetical protein